MRRSKYVGFLVIVLGILVVVGAAVLPVSPATERFGPFRIDVRGDTCGAAGYVAVRQPDSVCGSRARTRLLVAAAVGLFVVAIGMTLFAGGDEPHRSRIEVPTPRARRRSESRSRGSGGYTPG